MSARPEVEFSIQDALVALFEAGCDQPSCSRGCLWCRGEWCIRKFVVRKFERLRRLRMYAKIPGILLSIKDSFTLETNQVYIEVILMVN